MKRILSFLLAVTLVCSLSGCSTKAERSKYDDAVTLFEAGKYASALKLFEEVIDYKKSEDYAEICRYHEAIQIVSPDSSPEDGYSGTVLPCTEANASQYTQAVDLLTVLDGYRDSERILRDAKKLLDEYNSQVMSQRMVATIESKFLGYLDHCTYDGSNFYIYFSDSYPITLEVLQRGKTEPTVAESWIIVRGMFTDIIFDYVPDCVVHIIDRNGETLGSYLRGDDATQVTVLFDAASAGT